MDNRKAVSNASFVYSLNLLRMLLQMELITKDEYDKIIKISAEHHGTDLICV